MRSLTAGAIGAVAALLAVGTSAMAQSAYDDAACRQYADQQTAGLRAQANNQAVGGTLLGAGLGAALGAAVGGGRGAAIGAASGAVVGTAGGAANAQSTAAYAQQQYNAAYYQCMQSRTPAQNYVPQQPYQQYPQSGYGYQQGNGYQQGYGYQPGYGYGR